MKSKQNLWTIIQMRLTEEDREQYENGRWPDCDNVSEQRLEAGALLQHSPSILTTNQLGKLEAAEVVGYACIVFIYLRLS